MRTRRQILRSALLLVALAGAGAIPEAQAALEWPTKEFVGEALPLQRTLTVAFAFRNAGHAPVAIHDIQANCDCLEASVDKLIYEAGETGVITATFTVGERYGTYARTVTLATDDGTGPHRLAVRIEVPEPATFTPRTLEWEVGADAREQVTELRVAEGVTLEFSEVAASNRNFSARLEMIERGRRYRLHVAPATTDAAANGALRVKATLPGGEAIIVSTYANVR